MKTNEAKPLPLPTLADKNVTPAEYLRALNIDPWTPKQSLQILIHISEGKSLEESCKLEKTNSRSLHFYALNNKEYAQHLKMAQKLNAKITYSKVQSEFLNQINTLNELPVEKRAVALNRLYKYFERFTSLEDEEQDLKLRQAKEVAKIQEDKKSKHKEPHTIIISDFLKNSKDTIDVQKIRVDNAQSDDDKYFQGTE